jgi:large subunit ribosomal protein L1
MGQHGKKFRNASAKVDRMKRYSIDEACKLVPETKVAKFDESVDIAVRLGVDPKHADQMVRGTVVLPHGAGKTKKVAVIAAGEKVKEATAAGADFAGGADLVKQIQEGFADFDAVVATPDMMKEVGKLGKVLGPRGLMPNPKTGTVTFDITKAVREIKAGKVEFRVDKTAIIHVPVGRMSFDDQKIADNTLAVIHAVLRAKPPAAKGKYVESIYLCSTMGPSIAVDPVSVEIPVA